MPILPNVKCRGFTLLEVLVALVIVGTALGASLRAIGSLTQNSGDLRASMMATWSAENRLSQIRLAHEWPELGQRRSDCPQGELRLVCEENVFATPNPFFRRVEVSVFGAQNVDDAQNTSRRIIKLAQVVPNTPALAPNINYNNNLPNGVNGVGPSNGAVEDLPARASQTQ